VVVAFVVPIGVAIIILVVHLHPILDNGLPWTALLVRVASWYTAFTLGILSVSYTVSWIWGFGSVAVVLWVLAAITGAYRAGKRSTNGS